MAAQALLEMVLAVGLLDDCGRGRLHCEQTRSAESTLARATQEGLRTKQWEIAQEGCSALCMLATEHDSQLRNANAGDVIRVLRQVQELSQWANTTASKTR